MLFSYDTFSIDLGFLCSFCAPIFIIDWNFFVVPLSPYIYSIGIFSLYSYAHFYLVNAKQNELL